MDNLSEKWNPQLAITWLFLHEACGEYPALMTQAVQTSAAAASPAAPHAPSYIPPFGMRTIVGCLGVLLAVHVVGFNEHITEIGLADLRGEMHMGHDESLWFTSIYEAFNIASMAFTPWFYVTFSLYRFSLFVTALMAMLAIPLPFMHDLTAVYVLRAVQGLSAGCLPPILMTVMLKYLPAPIRVFGVGGYAMSATFGPNLGGPLEALWFEHVGWQWLYWEVLPLAAVALGMIAYGLPRDPMNMARFRNFNWRGFLLGVPSIVCVVTVLYHGDRLDWFRSPLITHLTFWGGALFIGFLVHEWFHHSPFFRIQFWGNRNIAMSMITLVATLMICGLMAEIPTAYLMEIRGYRPVQAAPISLIVALPQLALLPLTAALCNIRRVDCRYILAFGMSCMALAAWLGSWLTPDWVRDNFYIIQILQAIGQPTVVIPVLMLATMALGPADGPLISGMVNMLKGMANAIAAALFAILLRRREQFHSAMLLERHGDNATSLQGFGNPIGGQLAGTSPDSAHVGRNTLEVFHTFLHEQSTVLALADIYVVIMWICIFFVVLTAILPGRVYPPSAPKPLPSAS